MKKHCCYLDRNLILVRKSFPQLHCSMKLEARKRRFQDLLQCFSQQYQIPISRFTYPIELVLVDIASIEENLPGFDSASLLHAKLGSRIFTFATAASATAINVRIRCGSRHPLVIGDVSTNIGSVRSSTTYDSSFCFDE